MLRGIKLVMMLGVCMILMFFYGCSNSGGGGSSGDSSSDSNSLQAYSYYKFYLDYNSSSLYAVDPNNPTSSIYIDTIDKPNYASYSSVYNYPIIANILTWQYNAATYYAFNAHKAYIIYSKNGSIYKLTTDINAGLVPVQVSNLNANICSLSVKTKNIDPDLDFISVETAGADGICYGYCATTYTDYSADNQYYLVRLGMSSTDAPIAVPQDNYIYDHYYNYSTSNIGGIFIDNNGIYEACDDNLANCIPLNGANIYIIGDYPGKAYLTINGTEIYSFDKASKALTLIYTAPYLLDDFTQDGSNIYFDSNSAIYKLDTTSNSVISLYTDILPVDGLTFTNNKILYTTYNSTSDTTYIKLLDKTIPSYPITIFSFNLDLFSSPFSYYYLNRLVTDDKIIIPTSNATLIYDENGNLLQTFNGTIIGIQTSNSENMLSDKWTTAKILIYNNVTSTIKAISMSDLSTTTMAQPLPTDIIGWWSLSSSSSNTFLITGETNYQSSDIFFLDTSKTNSLIRVTNTLDDEFSLW